MVLIHCTNKMAKALKQKPLPLPISSQPTNRLGGWYANIIDTPAGELMLFTSEVTLISVIIPVATPDNLLPQFILRVEQQLRRLKLPDEVVEQEMGAYGELLLTKTASRSVLGTMNSIAEELWFYAEDKLQQRGQILEPSNAEDIINTALRGPSPYFKPAERTREILMQDEE